MYAVLETGGKQYKVAPGDKLKVESLDTNPGEEYTFDRVLLINNDGNIKVGNPTIPGGKITAEVAEHKRGPKLIAFKMKRRKGYRRTLGHKQDYTIVKINEISS
ncbi:MAG: 50S ribosomal protein L21 [Verrucomicrobia bacterium]|nr:50S ribosomal protein L21 [Verrucomicrobiota bacterium]MCF7708732.1 50S ribosomal protein L21 [Verrucomicrobiota bacterium]